MRWWPLWGTPIDRPLLQLHCSKSRWSSWAAAPLVDTAPAATDTPTTARVSSPWDIRTARCLPTMGSQGPVWRVPGRGIGWPSLRGGHPHQLMKAQNMMWGGWVPPVAFANMAYWGGADWSTGWLKDETIPAKREDEPENPLPLEAHLKQLLGKEEPSPVRDDLSEDPETSPMHHTGWIAWCTWNVLMPSWWEELEEIPGHEDYQLFSRMVCASCEIPGTHSRAKGVNNDNTPLPSHLSIGKYKFLPTWDEWFGTQDYWLTQPQHTLTYARALQHSTEKAHLPNLSKPCHLAGSVVELQWVMELLTTFTEDEVFVATVPSGWLVVTSPWLAEPIPTNPSCKHSCSQSHNHWAHPRGALLAVHGETQLTTTQKTDAASPPQELMPLPSHQATPKHQFTCPPPGFVETACTLWGGTSKSDWLLTVIGIPPQEAMDSCEVIGSPIMPTHIFWDTRSEEMFIDMLMWTLNIVDLVLTPWERTTQP